MTIKTNTSSASLRNNIIIAFVLVIVLWAIITNTFILKILQDVMNEEGLDKSVINNIGRHFMLTWTGLTILSSSIALFVALLLSNTITQPIKKLSLGMADMTAGKYDTRIEVSVKDEVGRLSSGFNLMAERIQKVLEELQSSEEKYKLLFESLAASVTVIDEKGIILMINNLGAKYFGGVPDNYIGKSLYKIFPDSADMLVRRHAEIFESGQCGVFEDLLQLPYGEKKWFMSDIMVLKDTKSDSYSIQIISYDITERKKAEDALRRAKEEIETWSGELERRVRVRTEELRKSHLRLIQSEKLSAMGELAAGLAHELNSPLAGLLPLIEKYRAREDENSEEHREMTLMLNGCLHMAKIVRDFGSFSRDDRRDFTRLDINDLIESTLSFGEGQLTRKGIEIIKEFGSDIPAVLGNRTELQQVILNMMTNARDVLEKGGRFTIITGVSEDRANVFMEFADNGIGIEKDDLDRLFHPFFTTKGQGEGIGLGLSVSYGIIKHHRGQIMVDSKPGKGARFTVLLPVET